jgi:hypothetical protein
VQRKDKEEKMRENKRGGGGKSRGAEDRHRREAYIARHKISIYILTCTIKKIQFYSVICVWNIHCFHAKFNSYSLQQ